MPYRIGEKGSGLGCSGYPVVDDKGKVVGCHPTRAKADNHLQALYANVPDAEKSAVAGANPSFTVDPKYPGVGMKKPQQGKGTTGGNIKSKYGKKPRNNRRGRSGDALDNGGYMGSGGPGGSIG